MLKDTSDSIRGCQLLQLEQYWSVLGSVASAFPVQGSSYNVFYVFMFFLVTNQFLGSNTIEKY